MAYVHLRFQKFSATGNDFILIDNREKIINSDDEAFFRQICQRRVSVGADGVLLIEKSNEFDFQLRYFNADGSAAECGNGARSAAFFAANNNIANDKMKFRFDDSIYEAAVNSALVKIKLPPPRDWKDDNKVLEEDFLEEGGFINTGVPHFVLFGHEIDKQNVHALGKKYRYHPHFQPAGTNVNFVEIISPNQIKVRTYERGVEKETLSCGTGCVASAIVAHRKKGTHFATEVVTPGGILKISQDDENGAAFLEGEVKLVYEGKLISP
jgi:diaminopimelate epimerase